jgi:ABC-type dipeptide/oligopeptide/nickel transport system permease subunit
MLILLFLPFVSPLFALLGVYEAWRGILALRRGESRLMVAKDFVAAALMLGIAAVILYFWHANRFHWGY